MAYRKRFQLSDESINSYGFWVVSAGIDLSSIQKNCPLFYNHRTWELPCGHVENIELNNGKLFGDIVIDGGNDIEREYIRKIEAGDIKGCSMGFEPIEWSDAPEYVKQGQSRAALTKSLAYEVSLTPLPANQNALALKNGNNALTLDANSNYDFIPELKIQSNMKEIALLLGQPESSTAEQLCAVLKPLLADAKAVVTLQKTVEAMGKDLPEAQHAIFVTLCKADIVQAFNFLTLNKPEVAGAPAAPEAAAAPVQLSVSVSSLIQKGKGKVELAADDKGSLDYLQKYNPVELARIKHEEPDRYTELAADYASGVRFVK